MSKHICGRCNAEFTSKAKCWYHMDFQCPKRKPYVEQYPKPARKRVPKLEKPNAL